MSYQKYKNAVNPLCPVAIRLDQMEVHAPGHDHWGVVSCEGCVAKFAIGPNRIHGSRMTDTTCAGKVEAILAEDHKQKRQHQNSIEIPD